MSRSHSSSKCGRDCGACPDRGEGRRARELAWQQADARELGDVEREMQVDAAIARADAAADRARAEWAAKFRMRVNAMRRLMALAPEDTVPPPQPDGDE